ncbi:cytidine deaminase [Kocuria massiliensis]|uniref:cytidine deaminase n=1 Tax=Kocuria massiliensis TaxID=1926282 RepID=UPI000A1CE4DF|nr:cytidine deaminase [Kocuria massiliensis]MCT1366460.1 cytidine deaminase [Rothia sp. p3-SID1597]
MTTTNHTNGEAPWEPLMLAAREALEHSYSPYSRYRVGAAARTSDGRLVTGANIENASYGVTLCAECSLVSDLFRTGGGSLSEFVCVNGDGEVIMPCGRCRQLLNEHRAPNLQIMTPLGPRTMDEVLPQAFGAADVGGNAPQNLRDQSQESSVQTRGHHE